MVFFYIHSIIVSIMGLIVILCYMSFLTLTWKQTDPTQNEMWCQATDTNTVRTNCIHAAFMAATRQT